MVVVAQRPVVEVAHHVPVILPFPVAVLIVQHQGNGVVVYEVDAMLQSCRHRAGLCRSGLERDVLCIGDLINEKVFAVLVAFFGAISTSDY